MRSLPLGVSLLAIAIAAPASAQEAGPKDDDFHIDREIVVTAPYLEQLDILAGTSAVSGVELAEKARGRNAAHAAAISLWR